MHFFNKLTKHIDPNFKGETSKTWTGLSYNCADRNRLSARASFLVFSPPLGKRKEIREWGKYSEQKRQLAPQPHLLLRWSTMQKLTCTHWEGCNTAGKVESERWQGGGLPRFPWDTEVFKLFVMTNDLINVAILWATLSSERNIGISN